MCKKLISILLVIILCTCSGCIIQAAAPEVECVHVMQKPPLVIFSQLTPTEVLIETKPTKVVKPLAITLEPPEVIEPVEPKTLYYDVPLSEDLQDHIFELCEIHNIDPALVIAVIRRESNYKASAIGDKGNSLGLMQIQPRWHQERMDRLNCPDLLDPYQNVTVGIDILSDLFDSGKSVEWVLMAYNGGRAYANRNWNAGVVSTYANKVLNIRDNLKLV